MSLRADEPAHPYVAGLLAKIQKLEDLLADKEKEAKSFFDPALKLSFMESKMLAAIYKAYPDCLQFDKMAGVSKVRLFAIRKKLKPLGIGIATRVGWGYCLTPLDHEALSQYVQK